MSALAQPRAQAVNNCINPQATTGWVVSPGTAGTAVKTQVLDSRFKGGTAVRGDWTVASPAGLPYIYPATTFSIAVGEVWTCSFRYAISGNGSTPTVSLGGGNTPIATYVKGTVDHGDGTKTAWMVATITGLTAGNTTPTALIGWSAMALNGWVLVGDCLFERAPAFNPYFDGSSPTCYWEGAANASRSTKPAFAAQEQTNHAQNPGCEVNITGWASNSGAVYVLTRDTTAPISGTASALFTRSATTPSGTVASFYGNGSATTNATNVSLPVTPGVPITWSVDVKAELADRRGRVSIAWRDAANAVVGVTDTNPVYTPLAAGQVTRLSHTAVSPAGAMFSYFTVNVTALAGNATTGERVWADNLRASFDGTTDYFDGSKPGCYWTGAVNASTSVKPGVPYQRWNGTRPETLSLAGQFDGSTIVPATFAEVEVV